MVRYVCFLLIIIQLHKVENATQVSLGKFSHSLPAPLASDAMIRRKKSAIPALPAPHQLLFPNKLHVLPARSNMHQSSVHTDVRIVTKDNVKIPIISQTVTRHGTNITHPSRTPLVHLLPPRDLTVIPLKVIPKLSLRMDASDDEPVNRFRTFYGGYGTGLLFGGHGAGHGFYAYG